MAVDLSVFQNQKSLIDQMQLQKEFELKKAIANATLMKTAQGADLPAPLQLANEYQKRIASGDVNGANLIMQFAKTQDKGLQVSIDPSTGQQTYSPLAGYAPAVGTIAGVKKGMEQDASNMSDANYKPGIAGAVEQAQADVQMKSKPIIAADTKTAEELSQGQANFPKTTAAYKDFSAKNDLLQQKIKDVSDRVNGGTAGFIGSTLSGVPGTAAHDMTQDLQSIRAQVGFDELQNMRNNSPTGGALGAVSENENRLLQSAVTNVENSQSPEQLKKNLASLATIKSQSADRVKQAYEQDLSRFGSGALSGIPAPGTGDGTTNSAPQGGLTVTVKKTKNIGGIPYVQFSDGTWHKGN